MITPYRKADISFSEIKELDEQGCFSRVYLAHDKNLDHDLVIKEIEKKPNVSQDNYFSEARLLYKNAHPNIVQVQYAAEDANNIYIAMPYYTNGTISKKLDSGNLSPREIIRYAIQFISGLHHIHTKKLIHFDIKPNNIMLSERNEAMLSDFGLTKLVDTNLRARPDSNYFFHTPPEYFSFSTNAHFSYTFDIYQSGMTLYRMCVGKKKYESDISIFHDAMQLAEAIQDGSFPPKKYPSNIPKKLITIINKCLAINPNDRYQSALDVANALCSIKDEDGGLDWKEVDSIDKNISTWQKELDSAKLEVKYDGVKKESSCYRIYEDGRARKESKGCITGVSLAKMYSVLREL